MSSFSTRSPSIFCVLSLLAIISPRHTRGSPLAPVSPFSGKEGVRRTRHLAPFEAQTPFGRMMFASIYQISCVTGTVRITLIFNFT